MKKKVCLYTDGACRGNPGPGGWGAILVYGAHEKELSGGEAETTNNRMELLAAIEGLSALRESCAVHLTSDSKYLVDAISLGWLAEWRRRAWRLKSGGAVKNPDLWMRLDELLSYHDVTLEWIKGHAGHPYNERCDALATAAADSFRDAQDKPPSHEQ